MIFVESIFKGIKMVEHLRILFLAKLQDKVYYIICLYFSIWKTNIKTI